MRNKTFISSMVLSVACVSAANAAVAFDSFTVPQSESNSSVLGAGINWASPASSQPIFGASGTRAAYAYGNGEIGTTTSSSVSGGTATFTTTAVGGAYAGLNYAGNAQDLTGYTFSFDLNMTGAESFFEVDVVSASGAYAAFIINYAGAGTYTVDLSSVPTFVIGYLTDFTAITDISFGLGAGSAGSATMSNFVYTPAPGAVALLGAAGLVGARRRRA